MSFYQNKNIVVTGAAGFIGSHLTDALLSKGANVIGVDNFLTGRRENIAHLHENRHFTFIHADVTSEPTTYLPKINIDCIFHFASPASPPGYQAHPVETYMVNSLGTHNILNYLKLHQPKTRFLFASTSEAYGDPSVSPQSESYFGNVNPNGVRSMYDESKRFGEMVCGVHFRSFDMDTRIVRIFNTFGPRMDPKDGRSLVEFCTKALADKPVEVYGDGTQTRSYCYVSDLVDGVLRLMSASCVSGETINIGNTQEQTMLQLINAISHELGKDIKIIFKPQRLDDPKMRQPDISKAKQLLDWEPKISFSEGLISTLTYFKTLV